VVLDNAIYASLTGPHGSLAERRGHAVRYPVDMSGFAALPDGPRPEDWRDLAQLASGAEGVAVAKLGVEPPAGWITLSRFSVVQMVGDGVDGRPDGEAVRLTTADVPEMLELVARTKPGPFGPRTIEMGAYVGFRQAGRLIAMAGQRFRPPGWTEISAVCTAPEFGGLGLATRLVRAQADEIQQRGDTPFLHVLASNIKAIALYETLGFTARGTTEVVIVRPPGPGFYEADVTT
jgi:ribosomal protein S18 acetylase RimI-like enzyme